VALERAEELALEGCWRVWGEVAPVGTSREGKEARARREQGAREGVTEGRELSYVRLHCAEETVLIPHPPHNIVVHVFRTVQVLA
jgi:hypothetical protein